jgi:integrase/recombinase XerD
MDKKIFHFRPAELRKCADRWQIIFYTEPPDAPGTWVRHRETWEMNRVESITERDKFAKKILSRLNNTLLPNGYPYVSIASIEKPGLSCAAAWQMAIAIKCRTPKKESVRTYKGIESVFAQFLSAEKLANVPVGTFSKKHVTAFSDYVTLVRKVAGRTHNKYMMHIHCAWQELVNRELVAENVWAKATRLKEAEVSRRVFTDAERIAVATYLYKNDRWLFYWVVLQYYCFIRGTELSRLRFSDFNIGEGFIYLSAEQTKNGKEAFVTIPESLDTLFTDEFFSMHPKSHFVFGAEMKPNAKKAVGKNTPNLRHHKAMQSLQKLGQLGDITDLSIYSWKYTGISDDLNAKLLDLVDTQSQARHATPTQTLTYYRKPKVNARVRRSTKDIFKTYAE